MMEDKIVWSDVDDYLIDKLITIDSELEDILRANEEADLPAIDVSPTQGKLLYLITKLRSPKNILEIGTLGGYSSLWFAKALNKGAKIYTLEANSKYANVARKNIEQTPFSDQVEIIEGKALETLPILDEREVQFDLIFIDADKENNPAYLNWALKLANKGAVIIADNIVRNGEIIEEHSTDPRIQGVRSFFDLLENHPQVESTAIQTVGQKGYDGFVLAIVK